METSPIVTRSMFTLALASIAVTIIICLSSLGLSSTLVVFCDVGQGNAVYMRVRNRLDVVIDAGPDRKVLECLGKYMPFYDREIELFIISHTDQDHFGGASSILDHYRVSRIIINSAYKKSASLDNLKTKMKFLGISSDTLFNGDKIKLNDGLITFYWPFVDFKSNTGNDTSSIFTYQEHGFRLLFTGDSEVEVLNGLKRRDIGDIDILQVPHHGSKNGLSEKFLRLANPRVAVISAGKNNHFGHPHKSVLDLLESKNIKIMRTDVNGDIKFILEE